MIPTLRLSEDTTTVGLFAVSYNIYITGGLSAEANSFTIKLVNKSTRENVKIFEHGLKVTDFSGVRYFYFNITKTGDYEVSFYNYNSIVVKKSQLFITNFFFSSKLDISDIRIRIERK